MYVYTHPTTTTPDLTITQAALKRSAPPPTPTALGEKAEKQEDGDESLAEKLSPPKKKQKVADLNDLYVEDMDEISDGEEVCRWIDMERRREAGTYRGKERTRYWQRGERKRKRERTRERERERRLNRAF